MFWQTVLIQGIGFVAVLLFLFSFQVKSNRSLFVLQTLGCSLFGIQFLLLGAYSGCLSLLINIIRNMMLTKYNEMALVRWRGWVVLFAALAAAVAWLTWDGPLSLLPAAGTIVSTAAYWTNNAKNIRLSNLLVNSPCLLVYDAVVHSWGGVLNETIVLFSVIISIYRFGWKALDGDTIK